MIRVVLVDDQPLIRSGLRVLIADTPDLEVAGEAGNGAEAVELVKRLRPDVAIMDIRMPGMDGIEATRRINADPDSKTRVLVLTTFDDDEYVYGALRAGASGFLVKDMPLKTILDGIRVVAAGDALIAPSVTRRLIEEFAARPEPAPTRRAVVDGITDRETRGPDPRRPRPVQHRDRRRAHHQRCHRQGPPRTALHQTRRTRPGPPRHPRLRDRPGRAPTVRFTRG